MKFSVLLSIYHKETPKNFEQCMQSITFDQSFQPHEIILVEDGKLNNDLYEVINTWKKKLGSILNVVPLKENVGLGKALNIGLSHCTNDWVFRMDTDDISLPDRFKKQLDFIQKHPDIAILSGQIVEFEDDPKHPTGTKKVPLTHSEILRFSRLRSPFNHMAVAYKKSVVESVGGYQHHMFMEDYNLWIRILHNGYKGANLEDNLLLVRAGNDMIKRRKGLIYIKSEWQLLKLKTNLGFQGIIPALTIFSARSIPRLLPDKALSKIYTLLRHPLN